MKKILAILLAAIMVFTLGVVSFAEGEEGGILLPEFPTQEEGRVFFASENIYVEAGQTYEIPVYVVSQYTPSIDGFAVLGFTAAIAGEAADYMSITAMSVSPEAQALAGYELLGCEVAMFEDISLNVVGIKTDDLSILNQEKFPLATVTVAVSEEYPGGELDCMLDLQPAQYYWFFDNELAQTIVSAIDIINAETGEAEYLFFDGEMGQVFFVSGHMTVEPPQPAWTDRLKDWAIDQALKILTFLQGIIEVLIGLLPTL